MGRLCAYHARGCLKPKTRLLHVLVNLQSEASRNSAFFLGPRRPEESAIVLGGGPEIRPCIGQRLQCFSFFATATNLTREALLPSPQLSTSSPSMFAS